MGRPVPVTDLPQGGGVAVPDDDLPSMAPEDPLVTSARESRMPSFKESVGRGAMPYMSGAKHLLLQLGEKMGDVPAGTAEAYRQANLEQESEYEMNRQFSAPGLMEGGSGPGFDWGALLGSVGATIPLTLLGGGPLAGPIQGAASEAMRLPQEGQTRWGNAAFGGGAGAVLPFGQYVAADGVRRLMRGPYQHAIKGNIGRFAAEGVQPTAGQVSPRGVGGAFEGYLTHAPGSAKAMHQAATREAEQFGSRVGQIVGEGATDPVVAGGAMQSGIREWMTGVKDVFGKMQDEIQDDLAQGARATESRSFATDWAPTQTKMVPFTRGKPEATMRQLGDLLDNIEPEFHGAAKAIEGGTPDRIRESFKKAAKEVETRGGASYETLRGIRTLVGEHLENPSIVDDVTRAKWKRVYGSLTEDLRGILRTKDRATTPGLKGAGPLEQKFDSANRMYKEAMDTYETQFASLIDSKQPEGAFFRAMNLARNGPTNMVALRKALPPEKMRDVESTWVSLMGRANPSAQNEVGDVFNISTFLTNYDRFRKNSPDTLNAIFGNKGAPLRDSIDRLAKIASDARKSGEAYVNPPKTARAAGAIAAGSILMGGALGGAAGLATGNDPGSLAQGGAVSVALAMLGNNIAARKMMTNPQFINWLARETKMMQPGLAGGAARLITAASFTSDKQRRRDMEEFAAGMQEQETQP